MLGEASSEDRRLSSPTSTDCSGPKVGVSLRGKCAVVPTIVPSTAPEPWLRDLPRGEAHHKTESTEPHLRGNYLIGNRAWRHSSLMVLSESMEVVAKAVVKETVDSLEIKAKL